MADARLALRPAAAEPATVLSLLIVAALAAFYLTVQQGMSIQARDGASEDRLLAVAKGAMAAWGPLTAP